MRTAAAMLLCLGLLACSAPAPAPGPAPGPYGVLVFSRTAGFRHDSIPAGVAALRALGADSGFTVTATEDPAVFTPDGLARFRAVVFLSTSGDVLGPGQQAALEAYVRGGGGWVGVHSAADTEYGWPFYGELVGARFDRHPAVRADQGVGHAPAAFGHRAGRGVHLRQRGLAVPARARARRPGAGERVGRRLGGVRRAGPDRGDRAAVPDRVRRAHRRLPDPDRVGHRAGARHGDRARHRRLGDVPGRDDGADRRPVRDPDAVSHVHRGQLRRGRRHAGPGNVFGVGPIVGLAGKCLDVDGGGTADGTQIQIWDCAGNPAQTWTRSGSTLRALGKCLDVSGGGSADGTKIQLWTCNGSGAQNWVAQSDQTVRNPQSAKCLDVSANSSVNGQDVHLWTCHAQVNQRWTLPA